MYVRLMCMSVCSMHISYFTQQWGGGGRMVRALSAAAAAVEKLRLLPFFYVSYIMKHI
jgi:hypothetical protein